VVTETRYFSEASATVNGVSGRSLRITPTVSQTIAVQADPNSVTLVTGYWGILVWKYHSDGTYDQITSSTPVAVFQRSSAGAAYGSGTWTPTSTSLALGDSIVVDVQNKIGTGAWGPLYAGGVLLRFTTEQLGANNLDAVPWTVYYNVNIINLVTQYTYRYYFDVYTSEDLIDQIDNFQWTAPAPPPSVRTPSGYKVGTTTVYIGAMHRPKLQMPKFKPIPRFPPFRPRSLNV